MGPLPQSTLTVEPAFYTQLDLAPPNRIHRHTSEQLHEHLDGDILLLLNIHINVMDDFSTVP